MAKKYYAVRTGRKTGVFLTWAESPILERIQHQEKAWGWMWKVA